MIRNYDKLREFISDYNNLSEQNKKEVSNFMKYLLAKGEK